MTIQFTISKTTIERIGRATMALFAAVLLGVLLSIASYGNLIQYRTSTIERSHCTGYFSETTIVGFIALNSNLTVICKK